MKYVYWFAYYSLDSPSVRYRGKYPLDKLRLAYGVNYSLVYPGYDLQNILNFISAYFSALLFRKKDSLIVIQRLYSRGIYATALKLLIWIRSKNTVYDLDDAEYDEQPLETIHFFMKNCNACSVGSRALYEYTKKYNHNTFLLTSPVTTHDKRKKSRNNVFTIGWVGCFWGKHWESLYQLVFPAIRDLNFKLKFVVLGAVRKEYREKAIHYFSKSKHVIIEMPEDIDWQNEDIIYDRIKEFDLGISPLLDNEINRCKSAYKLKQYFSCGIPAIGSKIGENTYFLKEGINGFFCNSSEYTLMIKKIKELENSEYQNLSDGAAESVYAFNLEYYCALLFKMYHKLNPEKYTSVQLLQV